jgi:hypothetical protein
VIAPNAASNTAETIAVTPIASWTPAGTGSVATTGAATMHTATIATDRNASIHMTARTVRS